MARIRQGSSGVSQGSRDAEEGAVVWLGGSQHCWEDGARWFTSLIATKEGYFYTIGCSACFLFGDKEQGCLLTGNLGEANTESQEVLQRWNIFCPLDQMSYVQYQSSSEIVSFSHKFFFGFFLVKDYDFFNLHRNVLGFCFVLFSFFPKGGGRSVFRTKSTWK